MSVVVPNAMVLSAIREKLEAIPGVDRVIAEGESVWLVCRSPLASAGILEKAQSVVRTSTAEGEPVRLEVVARADEIDRERVRFEGV